jgi:glucose-1-phosphate thymidylyltransferase
MVGSIEEVAFRMGYIDSTQLDRIARQFSGSTYGDYLRRLVVEGPGPQ